jgi:hypothetical protein
MDKINKLDEHQKEVSRERTKKTLSNTKPEWNPAAIKTGSIPVRSDEDELRDAADRIVTLQEQLEKAQDLLIEVYTGPHMPPGWLYELIGQYLTENKLI